MKRYFFDIQHGAATERDRVGIRLSPEAVLGTALKAVRALVTSEPERDGWSGWYVSVRDEDGVIVLFLPFSDTDGPKL